MTSNRGEWLYITAAARDAGVSRRTISPPPAAQEQGDAGSVEQAMAEYLKRRTEWYEMPVYDDNTEDVLSFHDAMTEALKALITAVRAQQAERITELQQVLKGALSSARKNMERALAAEAQVAGAHPKQSTQP